MTEIDGGEGRAESCLCLVRKEDNSSVSQTETEKREKKKGEQNCFGWILHMTKNVGGIMLYAVLTRKVTSQKDIVYHFIPLILSTRNNNSFLYISKIIIRMLELNYKAKLPNDSSRSTTRSRHFDWTQKEKRRSY